jgi:hypothetical protein
VRIAFYKETKLPSIGSKIRESVLSEVRQAADRSRKYSGKKTKISSRRAKKFGHVLFLGRADP